MAGISVYSTIHSEAERDSPDVATDGIRFMEPFGFFDFVHLEQGAACVLTDSGTVQEESCILSVPNVTIRDVTERPETIDVGSGILTGVSPGSILSGVGVAAIRSSTWRVPVECLALNVAETVSRIVLGFRFPAWGEAGRAASPASARE